MQDDKFSLIKQFPSLMDYEAYVLEFFAKTRPEPAPAGFFQRPTPAKAFIGGVAGKVTIQPRKGLRIGLRLEWQKSAIDASMSIEEALELLDALKGFLAEHEKYESHIEKQQAYFEWQKERDSLLEAACAQWESVWREWCAVEGVKWCANCGGIDVKEEGQVCEWCQGQAELDAEGGE